MSDIIVIFPKNCSIKVVFEPVSIDLCNRMVPSLENYGQIKDFLYDYGYLEISELNCSFGKKLAMYITHRIGIKHDDPLFYIVTPRDVLKEVTNMINDILQLCCFNSLQYNMRKMLDGYPLQLLASICGTDQDRAYLTGESVKRFIDARKILHNWIPVELYDVIDNTIPLIGHEKSPMTELELNAIYRYLGSKKNIYVTILLNTLFELEKHKKYIIMDIMDEETINKVCKSAWFFLFLFGSIQVEHLEEDMLPNVEDICI